MPTGALMNVAAAESTADRIDRRNRRRSAGPILRGRAADDEETDRLIVQAVAQGSLIPIVCVAAKHGGGLKELLETLAMCAPVADKIVRKATNDSGQEVEVKCDRGRAAGGAGLANAHRSVRAKAQLHPHLQRHDEERRKRSCVGAEEERQDRPALGGARERNQGHRSGLGRRHCGHRQDRRSAHRHDAGQL